MAGLAVAEALGVYVSVPFCRAKCSFCNFASDVGGAGAIAAYVRQLAAEIDDARRRAKAIGALLSEQVDTVYFGGGTPSLLAPEQLREIFAALRRNFDLAADAEVTMEAAPGQIADDLLETAQREGVNRISLGVQSFNDREAAMVGRTHTAEICTREFAWLRASGVADVGVDLIAGLPAQTLASWRESLAVLDEAPLTHASVYLFEIDEDSRLGAEVLRGGDRFHARAVGDEALAAEMYDAACEALPAQGFAQYEISNFAREGFRSRHNQKYWLRAPYIGFGLDAHSMLRAERGGDLRFGNADDLASYALGCRTLPEVIDERGALEETLFLGLRRLDGLRADALLERFDARSVSRLEDAVRELTTEGLMENVADVWRLSHRGRLISNEIFGRLLEQTSAMESREEQAIA